MICARIGLRQITARYRYASVIVLIRNPANAQGVGMTFVRRLTTSRRPVPSALRNRANQPKSPKSFAYSVSASRHASARPSSARSRSSGTRAAPNPASVGTVDNRSTAAPASAQIVVSPRRRRKLPELLAGHAQVGTSRRLCTLVNHLAGQFNCCRPDHPACALATGEVVSIAGSTVIRSAVALCISSEDCGQLR